MQVEYLSKLWDRMRENERVCCRTDVFVVVMRMCRRFSEKRGKSFGLRLRRVWYVRQLLGKTFSCLLDLTIRRNEQLHVKKRYCGAILSVLFVYVRPSPLLQRRIKRKDDLFCALLNDLYQTKKKRGKKRNSCGTKESSDEPPKKVRFVWLTKSDQLFRFV